jgi:hypothetical protein
VQSVASFQELATLAASLQAARAQIQVQSPAPIIRIRIPEAERFDCH